MRILEATSALMALRSFCGKSPTPSASTSGVDIFLRACDCARRGKTENVRPNMSSVEADACMQENLDGALTSAFSPLD